MLFSSLTFIFIFLPIVVIIYYMLAKNRCLKNMWLFFASIFFYATGGVVEHTILLLSCAVFNWLMALILEHFKEKRNALLKLTLLITIMGNLGTLVYYKYSSFLVSNLSDLLGINLHTGVAVLLPVGISFYIFQALSYIIDVYRGQKAEKSLLHVGLYISFFPQLIAGPIVRFGDISAELYHRKESFEDFSKGMVRFVTGFCKKVLLANTLGELVDLVFNYNESDRAVCFVWLGAIAYSLQIFYDFSGYSDMAIGLGKMFGFHYPENFNYPYMAKSITEFWRRWHISLSSFFRDYVYIPLGGSKVGKTRHIINLAVVWIATGVWHGANWTFVIWGGIYFILLAMEKFVFKPWKFKNQLNILIYRIFALVSIMLLWVIFRSDTIGKAGIYIKTMFGWNNNVFIDKATLFQVKNYFVFLVAGILAAVPSFFNRRLNGSDGNHVVKMGLYLALLLVFGVAIAQLMVGSYNPFIYFMF